MNGIDILGTGSYIPDFVADNDKFAEILDTSDEWITPRTGIKQRRISTDKPNYYMGAQAAKSALADANVKAEDIDLILVSTCTPDFFYPSASCLVQREIGAENAACIDVNSACTGFISALDIAQKYLAVTPSMKILIVATEKLSTHLDYTDRSMCILFGDGAGAAVISGADRLCCTALGAAGDDFKALYCKVNYVPNCPWHGDIDAFYENRFDTEEKRHYLQSDGHAVYKFAVNAMNKAVRTVLDKAQCTIDDIDLLIPHQANLRIIDKATDMLEISPDKVFKNIHKYGNISSACIPLALDELKKSGRLKSGMRICFVGFGAGLTYGAIIMDI